MKKNGIVAAIAVMVTAGSLLQVGPARADAMHGRPKVHDNDRAVAGHHVKVKPRHVDPVATTGRESPKVSWPAPGTSEFTMPSTGMTRAGTLPVLVGPVAGRRAAAPETAQVRMLSHQASRGLGVDVAFTVAAPETRSRAAARVRLDYASFAHAFGGDYRNRLRLARLPACALTTPEMPTCRQTTSITSSRNDTETQQLTAAITGISSTPTVLAATTTDSSDKGDYKATSLKASATWQVSTQTGSFSWSYPMRVPPVPGDLEPDLAIGYDSGAIDGRTANTNNQPSWVGEGFDLWPGYIERSYKSCADDGAPADEFGNKPSDQCWGYQNATVSWNGRASELIPAGDGTWRQKDDDGTRFEWVTGGTNGDNDGEYWKVTTTDGTQYYFGRNRLPGWSSGDAETNSAWTVPVFGNDAGEPCHDSTFAGSWCQQAYRWNLDYVVDPHGNAISYWYSQETNSYGRDLDPTHDTPYVRGGYLTRIDYGQRAGTLFTAKASARVAFDTDERCLPDASFDCDPSTIGDHPDKWPDVPWDLHCAAGTECSGDHGSVAPTFWSRKRLTKITTEVITSDGTGYRDVDSWTLAHEWGEADIDRALLLSSIQHTGLAGTTSIALPKVTFSYVQRMNRLDRTGDDIAPFIKYRLGTVDDESGGQIDVNYSDPQCTLDALPTPETNTKRCFPVYWTPEGFTDPKLDWFHKYVVTSVTQTDRTGGSPDMVTEYTYTGGGAWHYDDDDGLTKQKYKTWSQWRGYGQVRVETGSNTGMTTQTDLLYLRGMDGDRLNTDGGSKDVTVSDDEGGSYTDLDAYAGFQLETTHYTGPDGDVVDKTVTTPWHHQTASRTRSWGTTTANLTDTESTHTWTALAGGAWRETVSTQTHENTAGLVTQIDDKGDLATGNDDRCTRTSYAQDTSTWMLAYTARVETVAVNCASTPDRSKDVISDVRTSYDNGAFGAAPSKGDATDNEAIASHDGTTATYVTTQTATFDTYGRATSTTDAGGNTTTTGYTETNGLTTQTTQTSPPVTPGDSSTSLVTTTDLDPAWGVALDQVDPNLKRTDLAYDALGRLTDVWLPNVRKGLTPNKHFTYTLADNAIAAVGENDITPQGGPTPPTYTLYDGWLRPRQTQAPAQNGGRLLTDTLYDARGNVARSYATYYATGSPVATLFGVDTPGDVEAQTAYSYDGLGRKTLERFLTGNGDGVEKWHTSYSYSGDRVTVTPPAGGTATTTITDARGQTTELRQYHGSTPSGAYDATTYTYTPAGKPATVTDAAGNTWTHHYDLRGREIRTDDPDTGTTTSSYNDLDQLVSTTDARGKSLFYSYDPLGRKTAEREGTATGTLLAAWTYDTVRKGYPTSSIRYADGNAYEDRVNAYDNLYNVTRHTITIPAAEGALAGSYQFNQTFNLDGTQQGSGFPAAGGLVTEALSYAYDDLKRPIRVTGNLSSYLTNILYSDTGQLDQLELDTTAGKHVWETYSYEYGTRRLAESRVDRENIAGVDRDAHYHYDDAGNITSISDTSRTGTDTQCFSYDYLQRLTEAWTQPDTTCAATPSSAVIGGVAPYWQSFGYDVTGNRTSETDHGTDSADGAADTTRTYVYPAAGDPHPHAVSTVIQTGGAGNQTDSYGYNPSGDTTSRAVGDTSQSLSWDSEDHLASVTQDGQATSYLYDADGNRLLRHDPAGTTLYLPNLELRLDKTTNTVAATRYYTAGPGGPVVAVRTVAGVRFLPADAQGTALLSIDAASQAVTQRWYTPFGQPRGEAPAGWPGERGFVNGVQDPSTGLTHLGAREYDPDTGRFLSVDPVIDVGDPQQMNGYAYADNTPVTQTDPAGTRPECMEFGHCDSKVSKTGGQNAVSIGSGSSQGRHNPYAHNGLSSKTQRTIDSRAQAIADIAQRMAAATQRGREDQWADIWRSTHGPWAGPAAADYDAALEWWSYQIGTGTFVWNNRCGCYAVANTNALAYQYIGNTVTKLGPELALQAMAGHDGGGGGGNDLRINGARGSGELPIARQVPKALQGGSPDVHVYLGVRNGKPVYAGITNNIARRAAQHGDRFDQLRELTTGGAVTRGQARSIEEAMIVRNPGFENKIHSISPSRPYYQDAVNWGETWLRQNGY